MKKRLEPLFCETLTQSARTLTWLPILGQLTHKFEYFWGEKGVSTPVLQNHDTEAKYIRHGRPVFATH